jgi:hypothetical protein
MDAKHDASPSAKTAAPPEAGSLKTGSPPPPGASPAVAASHRRSERHARAASAEKPVKSGDATDADGGGARRERRRTRGSASPARGPASPPRTAPSSPVRSLSKTVSSSVAASADNSPALSSTPNRRRRPAGRSSAVAMAGTDATRTASDTEKAQQAHRVLGKYAARECTLLCEVILDHVRRNALAGDVLERQHSPACIRWDKVSKRMLKTHHLGMTARECQVLWKFLAYAEAPEGEDGNPTGSSDAGEAELLPASDEEDIERPIHEIHATQRGIGARRPKELARMLSFTSGSTPASPRAVSSDHADAQGADIEGKAGTITEGGAEVNQLGSSKSETSDAPHSADDSAASASNIPSHTAAAVGGRASGPVTLPVTASPSKRSDGIRLYPTYELPRGSLDGWQRPFGIKKMLPLSFVAEKFLKKRAVPIVKSPVTAAPANTATPAVKVERKVEAAASVSSGNQALVTVATTAATTAITAVPASSAVRLGNTAAIESQAETMAKKRPVSGAFAPNSTTAGAKPAKKKKTQPIKPVSTSSNQPRAPFVPSTTPPPAPTPAKTDLDFFRLVHARLNEGTGATNPSQEELVTIFQAAAPAIQEECKKLALIDVDRFNRECVRRRIWEKAMGAVSQSNSPLVSPAVASAASTAIGVSSNSGTVLPTS